MKKYLIIFLTTLLITSCAEQINRTPVDTLIQETAFQNVDDIEAGLIGVYGRRLPSGAVRSIDFVNQLSHNAIFTDNVKIGTDNGGQALSLLNLQLDSSTNSFGIWFSQYNTANDVNRILQAAESIEPESPEEQVRLNNLLAQSYLIRAYAHLELLLYYSEDIESPASAGVPYQSEVSVNAEPERITTGETTQLILDDITTAESLFSDDFDDVFRVNPDFAKFLRTRLALYTGDMPGVISNSNSLIAKFPLANQAQYTAMFNGDTDQTEVIYSYDNVAGANLQNAAGQFIFTGTGGNFIDMSNELFGILQAESDNNNDIRFEVNVNQNGDLDGGELGINKYPPGSGQFINDYKAARISEVYLMRAEAFAKQSQFQAAADAVQAVRNARRDASDNASAYASLTEAITDIKFERRLELCFEGHRYNDIRRYRNILSQGLSRNPDDCVGSIPCGINVNDQRWVFPIPIQELNGNSNMVQNTQWQ